MDWRGYIQQDMKGLEAPFLDPVDIVSGPAAVARKVGAKAFAGIPLDIIASLVGDRTAESVKGVPILSTVAPLTASVATGFGGAKLADMATDPRFQQAAFSPLANQRGLWTIYDGAEDATQGQFSALHDRVPRVEIDDSAAQVVWPFGKSGEGVSSRRLDNWIDHDELFDRHPELGGIEVNVDTRRTGGQYRPRVNVNGQYAGPGEVVDGAIQQIDVGANTPTELKQTLLHEIQHALQERGGMARGGSPEQFRTYDQSSIRQLNDALSLRTFMQDNPNNGIEQSIKKFREVFGRDPVKAADVTAMKNNSEWLIRQISEAENFNPQDQYRRLAGEIEARDAAARRNLSAEQRRSTQPYSSEEIALSDFIVRKDSGTMASMDDYRGNHRPLTVEAGAATLDDLTPAFGEDIYSPNAVQYFGTGDAKLDRQTVRILSDLRGNPDKEVTVYRAIPKNANAAELNPGDWVTVNRDYARMHGEGSLEGDYRIVEQKVKAKDLTTNADSFHEQGYYPK